MNVPLTMVGVPTRAPTRTDPLHAVVELDSPWPATDWAAMVSRHTAFTGEGGGGQLREEGGERGGREGRGDEGEL